MAAKFVTKGYGQVEPNRLTGIVNGNIEAQAPAYTDLTAATPISELENGSFLCVVADTTETSPSGRIAVPPSAAPATSVPFMVFSEKKIYDERLGYSDFVDRASDKVDGILYPRLVGLTPDACVFTTNTIDENNTANSGTISVGDVLYIGDKGILSATKGTNSTYQFSVAKVYTMPDGQEGLKLQVQVQVQA